jgi:cytochrome c oxidase assembly protein subunit 11
MTQQRKHYKVLPFLLLAGIAMGVVAYASVPLYRMFCSATGYNGTTQRVAAAPAPTAVADRVVTVGFDTNVDPNLPWDFKPDVSHIDVKLGETNIAKFHAHNRSDKTIVGEATFNVQPDKAGQYFDKIQCFCFDKQVLKPGETAEMDVQFYVDPAIAADKNTNDVQNITLSYTFFRSKDQSLPGEAKAKTSVTIQPKASGNPS